MSKKIDWLKFFIFFIALILPAIIYVLLLRFGLESTPGRWLFIAMYYVPLGIIAYYKNKQ